MLDDPRVQEAIEQMLDSGIGPEEACRDSPDLLPLVREGWRRVRAMEARIGEIFPEGDTTRFEHGELTDEGLPEVPGYEVHRASWAAAAWASSTRPGRSA